MKLLISLIAILLPQRLKKSIYKTIFHYSIGENVYIGFSWLFAENMEIGNGVNIGHLNVFKKVPLVVIGRDTVISNRNIFTSCHLFTNEIGRIKKGVNPKIEIGCHVGVGIGHYFDIQDTIKIGDFTTIAGLGSHFFTHQIDISKSSQTAKPIIIGKYCMIGSSVNICPGSTVADFTVVGMGSVISKVYTKEFTLIAGNPAIVIKNYPPDLKYFSRSQGIIS